MIFLNIINAICGVKQKPEVKKQGILESEGRLSSTDPHSYANPADVRTNHIHIELEIDFNKTQLHGKVILYLTKKNIHTKTVKLDARGLKIWSVYHLDGDNSSSVPLNWKYTESYINNTLSSFGDLFEISLPHTKKHRIEITYTTKECPSQQEHCGGLYWFHNQTLFYSLGQPIYTRQWIPCQDTATAKTTYTAVITAPDMLKVLMSASEVKTIDRKEEGKKITTFSQVKPIATYLIVLAIGNFKR